MYACLCAQGGIEIKPKKVVKDRKDLEAEWAGKWNEAGLKLAQLVMDETDAPNEALFLLDIAKTMIENAVKAVELETKKKEPMRLAHTSKNGVKFYTRKKPERGR